MNEVDLIVAKFRTHQEAAEATLEYYRHLSDGVPPVVGS